MGDGTHVDIINAKMQPTASVAVGLTPTDIVDLSDALSNDFVELYNAGANTVWITFEATDTPAVGFGFPLKGSVGGDGGGTWAAPGGKAIIGFIKGITTVAPANVIVIRGT